jgi:3-deoxy-D-manno-octulosonic-acid transferase
LAFYQAATTLLAPLAGPWLAARARAGKEDQARINERFGRYTCERPQGPVAWLHGASIGESTIALSLIEALGARDPALSFVLTTGTRTSAELALRRAPPRMQHVYAPLDTHAATRAFLEHWRPDLGVFVESEIWPNLILAAERRGVKLALVNARMSVKTLRRWERWSAAGARLMRAFAFVSAADARTARTLKRLRGQDVPARGNLKLAAPAPRIDIAARSALAEAVHGRKLWLAASTHPGEDEIALAAHDRIRADIPDALLVVAPRHPERGEAVAALAHGAPRRANNEALANASVYVADTLGELGVFYDIAPVALVAGSLLPLLKGHNPIEPAKLGAAIVTGPHVESFQDIYEALFAAKGAIRVSHAPELAQAVLHLWRNEDARAEQIEAARTIANQGADAFNHTLLALSALLPEPAPKTYAHASA